MELSVRQWTRISLFNLLILAWIGVTLRYKIAYYLPFIQQKHLLHGHSHFAFAGWISLALMVLMVHYLHQKGIQGSFRKYRFILWAHLITAVGMLISFPIEGYGLFSIFFSTASIVVSYFFSVMFWIDLNRLPEKQISHNWFKASLVFSALSSLGAFALALMMVKRLTHQDWYLMAEYFFLHFQYNGWFFFACMGIAADKLYALGVPENKLRLIYRCFIMSAVPAFLLSTLWMNLPAWLYIITVIFVLIQLAGWFELFLTIKQNVFPRRFEIIKPARIILSLSFMALTIKIFLQSGSVIPVMSTLAFGFRPIVIGYLHLVLLGFTSLFIIGSMLEERLIPVYRLTIWGLFIFTTGIMLNEIFLMLQGITGLYYQTIPYINQWLLAAAITMFSGLGLMNLSFLKKVS